MADELEIPHFMDHRPNGRCRAWWMAHEDCPGNKNAHEWAKEHVDEFLKKALALDKKHGVVPGCRDPLKGKTPVRMPYSRIATEADMKKIRKRSRAAC